MIKQTLCEVTVLFGLQFRFFGKFFGKLLHENSNYQDLIYNLYIQLKPVGSSKLVILISCGG